MSYFKSFGVGEGEDKFHEEAVYGVALMYSVLYNAIATYLDQYDLSPAKMNALMVIKHQGKDAGISQVEIGTHLMVTASNMTRLIDNLEKDGLIARSAHAVDRRVNIVKITPKGAKLMDNLWPGYIEKIRKLTGVISVSDQKQVAQLLSSWLKKTADLRI